MKMTTNATPTTRSLKYNGDYIGMRFGNLVVIGYPANEKGIRYAGCFCRCDCGNVEMFETSELFRGVRVHCRKCGRKLIGEAAKRREAKKRSVHDELVYQLRNERLYKVWVNMKARCVYPNNPSYRYYGAKGVKVCDEWLDYLVFREWAYSHGYDKDATKGQCTIDRINPFGNYEPSNCRFVDLKTQARNKRHHWAQLDEEVREALLATSLVT